jgi:hypothetical protein
LVFGFWFFPIFDNFDLVKSEVLERYQVLDFVLHFGFEKLNLRGAGTSGIAPTYSIGFG